MICRTWHGWTTPGNASAYEHLLRSEIAVEIERRAIAGFRGIQLLRRDLDAEIEFMTLMWFDSWDAVRAFAGDDPGQAVVPPQARALLARFEQRVVHLTVVEPGPLAPSR